MIHKNKNFSFGRNVSDVKDGDTFVECHLEQARRDTAIFVGVKNLTFEQCNLKNAVVPHDAIVKGGLVIKKHMCSNIHTDLVDQGLLPPEPVDCPHSIFVEGVEIDDKTAVAPYYEYDEDQFDEVTKEPKFVEYRHVDNGKIVDGKKAL